jgi:hypothetical protein
MMVSMNMTVFWDVAQCSQVDIDHFFRGSYCLHLQEENSCEVSISIYQTTQCNMCNLYLVCKILLTLKSIVNT